MLEDAVSPTQNARRIIYSGQWIWVGEPRGTGVDEVNVALLWAISR